MTETTTNRSLDVIVIGGGFGGLAAAKALLQWGITDFLLLEKGADLGGIWRENTYPGVRCDIPAPLYSLAGDLPENPVRHPEGDFHRRYLRDIASKYNLWSKIRLNTAVTQLTYCDKTGLWTVTTANGDMYTARFVIPAVGMLHIPSTPDFAGKESFKVPQVHTARWDKSLDLQGKRVAVIGTGPSAVQLIPELAKTAAQVIVFQRSAGWVVPLKGKNDFSRSTTAIFRRWPVLQQVYRQVVLYGSSAVLSPVATQGWSSRPLTWWSKLYLRQQVRERSLRQKLTPTYPLGCKRIIVERDYYRSIQQPNVQLVTDKIERFTPNGITTTEETAYDVDIVVYATGFDTSEFLQAIHVTGKGGVNLKDWLVAHKLSYLGIATENFPGLLTVHNYHSFTASGSNIFMAESQAGLVARAVKWTLCHGPGYILEVREDVMQSYKVFLERLLTKTVYGSCGSWYRDREGRIINIWPRSPLRFRRETRRSVQEVFRLVKLPC